MHVVLAIYTSL